MSAQMKGYVYVIERGDGLVKIGFTRYPESRIRSLSNQHRWDVHVWALIEGTLATEAMLHRRYAADRVEGEWFRASDDLLDACEGGTLLVRRGGLCKFKRERAGTQRRVPVLPDGAEGDAK